MNSIAGSLVRNRRDQVHVILGCQVEDLIEGSPVDLVARGVGGQAAWKAENRTIKGAPTRRTRRRSAQASPCPRIRDWCPNR